MSRLLSADDVSRVLRRLAHELIEANHGAADLVLLGIQTRGVPLAERLAGLIADIEGVEVPHGALDTTLYRDDLDTKAPRSIGDTRVPVAIDGRTVVLVDDVLYTGRTIRAALDAVAELGRPGSIRLVVLVDRGHRELPIRADHVGKNLPTAYGDHVQVLLAEVDGEDGVIAGRANDGGANDGGANDHRAGSGAPPGDRPGSGAPPGDRPGSGAPPGDRPGSGAPPGGRPEREPDRDATTTGGGER